MNAYRRKTVLLIISLLLLGGVIALLLGPTAVRNLPTSVRARLPEQVLALVETPLPTALPAPLLSRTARPTIILPTLAPATPTLTATPTNSPEPVRETATGTAVPPTPTLTPTASATPTATRPPLPVAVQLEGLEVIPQKFNNCGPANLTITLNYYDYPADQLEIGDMLKPNYDDRNVSPEELVAYVQAETPFAAAVYRGGELVLLKRLLAAGYPVIVEKGLQPSEWQGWMGHYLTLGGYDDETQTFFSLDTFLGPWDSSGRLEPYEELLTLWSHFNYTFIVVYPPEEEGEIEALLGPAFQEPALMWQQAAVQAQAEVEQEPENSFAWFNLGSSLTRLAVLTGESTYYQSASAAFDEARALGLPWRMLWYQFQPYEAYLANGRFEDVLILTGAILTSAGGQNVEETYLYRGHALLAQGQTAEAEAAYRRALNLNPNLEAARQALENGS